MDKKRDERHQEPVHRLVRNVIAPIFKSKTGQIKSDAARPNLHKPSVSLALEIDHLFLFLAYHMWMPL